MKEISVNSAGFITPNIPGLYIIPSINFGAVTALQSGYIITLSFTNAHNIPVSGNIINTAIPYIFITTASSTITTGWYSSVSVINANTVTCVSTISQNVISPITLTPTGSTPQIFSSTLINIPGNYLKVGSVLEIEAFLTLPTSITRAATFGIFPSTATNTIGAFFTTSLNTSTYNLYVKSISVFLTSSSDSVFVSAINGSSGTNTLTNNLQGVGNNVSLINGFNLECIINFNNISVNDYALLTLFRAEIMT